MATQSQDQSAKPLESPAFPAVEDAKFPSKSTTNSIIIISVVIAAVVAVFAMFSPKVGPANEIKMTPNAETAPIRQTADPALVGQPQAPVESQSNTVQK